MWGRYGYMHCHQRLSKATVKIFWSSTYHSYRALIDCLYSHHSLSLNRIVNSIRCSCVLSLYSLIFINFLMKQQLISIFPVDRRYASLWWPLWRHALVCWQIGPSYSFPWFRISVRQIWKVRTALCALRGCQEYPEVEGCCNALLLSKKVIICYNGKHKFCAMNL